MNCLWLPWNLAYILLYEASKRRVYYWQLRRMAGGGGGGGVTESQVRRAAGAQWAPSAAALRAARAAL